MKKIIVILVITLCLALLYVKGQIELVRLSYQIKNEEKETEKLISLNKTLEYELAILESPAILESRFAAVSSDSEDIQLTSWKIAGTVRTSPARIDTKPALVASARPKLERNIWEVIFRGLVAEAEANSME